jgi:hypothetical protein
LRVVGEIIDILNRIAGSENYSTSFSNMKAVRLGQRTRVLEERKYGVAVVERY